MIFGCFNVRELGDFLTGTTVWLRESPFNDVEKAAEHVAGEVRRGVQNGFFGEVLTHEQKFQAVTVEEWDRILARAAEKTSRHEKIFTTHDDIALYLKSKDETWLARVEQKDGSVCGVMSGRAQHGLQPSLFSDVDDSVERRYLAVPAYRAEGQVEIEG